MASIQESQENRLQIFANIFKGYMGIMPILTAALAPLLTAMNVIPAYESQRKPLATMAGVLGFLLLGWLFYVRRTIALGSIKHGYRWFFNSCPLFLIAGSIICYVSYANTLDRSLAGTVSATITRAQALSTVEPGGPASLQLQLLYLGMFLFAEGAFVMMALREYANDVRGISEREWMFGYQDGTGLPEAQLPGAQQVNSQNPIAPQLSATADSAASRLNG
jgi:hypothetical protein